jgi:hypothetical protein
VTEDPRIVAAFLRQAGRDAADSQKTLREQLDAIEGDALSLIRDGSISQVSRASASHNYFSFGPGRITQTQIVSIAAFLISLHADAVVALGIAAPVVDDNAAIQAQMESKLRPVKGYTSNFMYLAK